jgi:hypothetical protein
MTAFWYTALCILIEVDDVSEVSTSSIMAIALMKGSTYL